MYSAAYVWGKILGKLEERITAPLVNLWFNDVEVLEYSDDRLVLFVPDEFRKDTIEKRTLGYIREIVKEQFDLDITVTVIGEDQLEGFQAKKRKMDFLDFNPQFTFEKFIVGSSNRFAHAAALAMATEGEAPDGYNPLFIYGPPGLGKTHLLYAIASKIHKDNPDANIVYIKAEQFTNELIAAIADGKMVSFREKYRGADVFLVDDVQFIAGKESTQEEYFHTFNTLYESKRKIIMTADRHPDNMAKLEERLKTRFEWGIIADINPPDYETRMAILRMGMMEAGLNCPDEVCNYIAENVTSDVRKLEGAINVLKATVALEHVEIDLSLANRVLKNIKPSGKSLPTPQLILSEVCRFYSLDESSIRSNQKNKAVSEARQVTMYLLKTMVGMSTPDIGRELGRDHSTVVYGCKKMETLLKDQNTGLQDNIRDITSNINSKL